jgi:ABC-type transport system involved in Fe-S cluster assembly fused permease/ATPase subunit
MTKELYIGSRAIANVISLACLLFLGMYFDIKIVITALIITYSVVFLISLILYLISLGKLRRAIIDSERNARDNRNRYRASNTKANK